MAYDDGLAHRVRGLLAGKAGISAKEMFGGIAFMLDGNMCCGIIGEDLMVRVGPDDYASALKEEHVVEFDMTGRPMRGWVVVQAPGLGTTNGLREWVERGVRFASTLPPK